jgi:hypothetical protein
LVGLSVFAMGYYGYKSIISAGVKELNHFEKLLVKQIKDLGPVPLDVYGKINNFDYMLKYRATVMRHIKMLLERREMEIS